MCVSVCVFFFKQKTAYEMRISDWSSDVCSSELGSAEMALDLSLEPGQQMLRDGLRRFLADNAWPGWRSLSDALGLGGVAVPEGGGGFGGGMRDRQSVV